MANIGKVLGQASLAATTNTDVYTVPEATSAVLSTISVCNRTSGALSTRVAVRPKGAAIANEHYIYYDVSIAANTSDFIGRGITVASTDVVTAYASATGISVSVFGIETS